MLQTESQTIEVLPKIAGEDNQVRRNLVGMLNVALDLEIGEGEMARVRKQTQSLLEVLIRLYCDKLSEQLRRGLVRRYEAHEENLAFVRGRLSIADQTRRNAANPERLYCRFEEFREDNPLNIILKASLRMLLRHSRSSGNQRLLSELLLAFEGVSDCSIASLPWSRVRFDRLNERYQPVFRLARMFLHQTSPDVTAGNAHGFSLFFDMNVLFEQYIGRMSLPVLRKRGLRGRLQGPRKYVANDMAEAKPVFAMKPDLVATEGALAKLIVDTKWKRLSPEESKEGVAQADLYQMYAYAHCYGCTTMLLLYPHDVQLGNEPGVRRRFRLNSAARGTHAGEGAVLSIATIDLTDLRMVASQLNKLFDMPCSILLAPAP
ncbi:McrC family protein [Caballeronia sp. LZ035]|uniref:McrC family protein n=1 Tax=Caballeronia sp. LZ035 TaxID=3038568 RepID=UPI00285DC4E5|nr:McrC family protein [Caballeronia sp. LZ035]MDR5761475.1 McrC family protein [Caballeronia sp. LZ035]